MRKRPLLRFHEDEKSPLISSKSALSTEGHHEVGSFPTFSRFTPIFTPFVLIKNGFNILNSITYYFSPLNFLLVIMSVFVLMVVSFVPSLILLYRRKNNILLD